MSAATPARGQRAVSNGLLTTIGVICWNTEKYVEECLESVMRSTHPERRAVVVLDNASEDETQNRIRGFLKAHGLSWTFIANPANAGMTRASNQILALVDTPFFAYLDSDDFVDSNRFSLQEEALLASRPEVVMVGGKLAPVSETGEPRTTRYLEAIDCDGTRPAQELWFQRPRETVMVNSETKWVNTPYTPTQMWRTSTLRAAGGADERFWADDVGRLLRVIQDPRVCFLNVPDAITYYRRNPTGSTMSLSAAHRALVLETSLAEFDWPDYPRLRLGEMARDLRVLADYESAILGLREVSFRSRAAMLRHVMNGRLKLRSRANALLLGLHPLAGSRVRARYRQAQMPEKVSEA